MLCKSICDQICLYRNLLFLVVAVVKQSIQKNSQAVKKVRPQKGRVKKDVKSKVAAKKYSCDGRLVAKLIHNNSDEFVLPSPKIQHQIHLNYRY